MIGFQRHMPDNIPEQAVNWLKLASERTGIGHVSVDVCIANCNSPNVMIYTVEDDGLKGCFCLTLREIENKRILTMLLLGGTGIKEWKDDLVNFLEATAQKYSCTDFYMMGPLGWDKIFPEIKPLSCVYGKTPAYLTQAVKNVQ